MEKLYADRSVNQTDMDSMYEALFLRAVTSYESFLEDLFVAILEGRARYRRARKVRVNMTATSRDSLMKIVRHGDAYMKWLPFENTEKRAEIYLSGGRPFCEFSDGDKTIMRIITTIRNAIAHKSDYAMRKFENIVTARTLLPNERKPAGYLRASAAGGRTRFEAYLGELGRLANALC